jgi:hypothetical protein
MSRTARLGVLIVTLSSVFALGAATASAVTWHNSGDTAYTATGGGTTLGVTGTNLVCTGSTFTGTAGAGTFVGLTWTAATGTGSFTGCTLSGISATTSCTYKVTATTWTAGPPAVMSGGADVTCTSYVFGSLNCVTKGTTAGTYTNPTATTTGRGVAPASSTLTIHDGAGACMLGNNETATISATPLTITAASGGPSSPHQGPVVTRTA